MSPVKIQILKYTLKITLCLFLLLILMTPAVHSDQMTSVNITVGEKKSAEMTFSIEPISAYQNQDIDFIIAVKNTGNLVISAKPEIKIYSGSILIATLTFESANITVGGNVTFMASWNTDSNLPGDCTAIASVHYDNETLSATNAFSISGIPLFQIYRDKDWPPTLPKEAAPGYVKLPVLAELRQSETLMTDITVKNFAETDLTNLKVNISGVPDGWMDIFPSSINIAPNSSTTFRIYASIPFNSSPGDYKVTLTASNSMVEAKNFFILRVKPYPHGNSIPTVTRLVTIDIEKQIVLVNLKITNYAGFTEKIEVLESIPKSIASSTDQIYFETPTAKIIEEDPLVKWIIEELKTGESRLISYSIQGISDEYFHYVYWPVKEVNVFYEPQEIIKISSIPPQFIAPNETAEVKLSIKNLDMKPTRIAARLEPPSQWTFSPKEIITTLPVGGQETLIFSITPPSDAASASYNLKLLVRHDSGVIIENIPLQVQLKLPLFYIIPPAGLVILMVGLLYLKRRGTTHL